MGRSAPVSMELMEVSVELYSRLVRGVMQLFMREPFAIGEPSRPREFPNRRGDMSISRMTGIGWLAIPFGAPVMLDRRGF